MRDVDFSTNDMQEALEYATKIVGWVPSLSEYEQVRSREQVAYASLGREELKAVAEGSVVNWMPSASTIRQRYKTWELATASLREKHPKSSKRTDLTFLKSIVYEIKRPVNEKQYEAYRQERDPSAPHASSLIRGFGGWPEVISAVGQASSHYKHWSKEKLTDALVELSRPFGHALSIKEYEAIRKDKGLPYYRQFLRYYEDWASLKTTVEAIICPRRVNPNSLINQLVAQRKKPISLEPLLEVCQKLGHTPTVENYRSEQTGKFDWPTVEQIRGEFGSWKVATRKAMTELEARKVKV